MSRLFNYTAVSDLTSWWVYSLDERIFIELPDVGLALWVSRQPSVSGCVPLVLSLLMMFLGAVSVLASGLCPSPRDQVCDSLWPLGSVNTHKSTNAGWVGWGSSKLLPREVVAETVSFHLASGTQGPPCLNIGLFKALAGPCLWLRV